MRLARIVLVMVAVLVAAGCQVDADVHLQMRPDGSGTVTATVTLDPEAAAMVPDLDEQLEVADLEAVGWRVDGPATIEGGALQIRATKGFDTPEQGEAVLAEVSGPDGFLADVELDRDRSFARTTYRFAASSDPGDGVAGLADSDLAELIGGDLGGRLPLIEEETGASADEQVTVTLRVQLPGSSSAWALTPGGDAEVFEVSHEEVRWLPVGLVAAAGLLGLLGVVLLVVRLVQAVRRRGRRDDDAEVAAAARPVRSGTEPGSESELAADAPAASTEEGEVSVDTIAWGADDADGVVASSAAGGATGADDPPERRLRLVVLDVMGVVFRTGPETVALLASFARDRGSTVDADAVASSWALASEGRLSVGELWASLGLTDDPGDLSDEFLAVHRLRPGIRDFLERMAGREMAVAAVANDVAEWSRRLRSTHKLDHLTRAWIVSGDVGERLPGGAVLGRAIQVTGIDARDALFISDRVDYLDAARSFGFAGAWFAGPVSDGEPGPADGEHGAYPVLHSFADLAP